MESKKEEGRWSQRRREEDGVKDGGRKMESKMEGGRWSQRWREGDGVKDGGREMESKMADGCCVVFAQTQICMYNQRTTSPLVKTSL